MGYLYKGNAKLIEQRSYGWQPPEPDFQASSYTGNMSVILQRRMHFDTVPVGIGASVQKKSIIRTAFRSDVWFTGLTEPNSCLRRNH